MINLKNLRKDELLVSFKFDRLEFYYGKYGSDWQKIQLLAIIKNIQIYNRGKVLEEYEFKYMLEKTIGDLKLNFKRLILVIGDGVEIELIQLPKLIGDEVLKIIENNNPFKEDKDFDYLITGEDIDKIHIMYFGIDRLLVDKLNKYFDFLKNIDIYIDHELNAIRKYGKAMNLVAENFLYLEVFDELVYVYEYKNHFLKREEIDKNNLNSLERLSYKSLLVRNYSGYLDIEGSKIIEDSLISLGGFIRYD